MRRNLLIGTIALLCITLALPVLTSEKVNTGKAECKACKAEDKAACKAEGKAESQTCKAEGKAECKACKAEGKAECKACKAEGKAECQTCKAEDKAECKACKAEGKAECKACKAECKAVKNKIGTALQKMKERKPQTKCPINGNPVTDNASFTYIRPH